MKKPIISLYGGHNSSITVYDPNRDRFYLFDIERIQLKKNFRLSDALFGTLEVIPSYYERNSGIYNKILRILKRRYEVDNDFLSYTYADRCDVYNQGKDIFQYQKDLDKRRAFCLHHEAHMWSSYMQSNYDNCFVISYDGGGDGTSFNVYKIQNGEIVWEEKKIYDFGPLYLLIMNDSDVFKDKTEQKLEIAGKAMGLSAYGKILLPIEEELNRLSRLTPDDKILKSWHDTMMEWSKSSHRGASYHFISSQYKRCCAPYNDLYVNRIKKITKDHNATDADVAYTIQKFLEDKIIGLIQKDYIEHIKECDNNLILTGGVALNVLVNQKIKEEFRDVNVFVASNPHDGGLSVGMAYKAAMKAGYIEKGKKYNLEANGLDLFDIDLFDKHKARYRHSVVDISQISNMLKDGKIIGFLQGKMEIGPRALGNRSILCDASYPDMKDIINSKVKFREEFRPFAPMCRKEDADIYFDARDFDNTENMSFTVNVKPEYRDKLRSITHVDNTARLQTVTKESNETMHELLTEFGGVLLNTSFNVQGQPILNSIEDAHKVLTNTALDGYIVKYQEKFYHFY